MVRIKNTLHLGEIYISEALLPEAEKNPSIEVLGKAEEFRFDSLGNLLPDDH